MKKVTLLTMVLVSQLIAQSVFAGRAFDGKWSTPYFKGYGKVTIEVDGDLVTVNEDRNACSLNAIGEASICTRMATLPSNGTLKKNIEASKIFPRGTMIYKIEGTHFGVVYFKSPASTWLRLLEYNNDGEVIFASPLSPSK